MSGTTEGRGGRGEAGRAGALGEPASRPTEMDFLVWAGHMLLIALGSFLLIFGAIEASLEEGWKQIVAGLAALAGLLLLGWSMITYIRWRQARIERMRAARRPFG